VPIGYKGERSIFDLEDPSSINSLRRVSPIFNEVLGLTGPDDIPEAINLG
jgi:hypothetical protein